MDEKTAAKIIKDFLEKNEPLLKVVGDKITYFVEAEDWQGLTLYSGWLGTTALYIQTLLPDEYRPDGLKGDKFDVKKHMTFH
jgi:hypothetical protein